MAVGYRKIFEIADVTPVLLDTWLIQGRAYEDIEVGDRVAADLGIYREIRVGDMIVVPSEKSPNDQEPLFFDVIAATTYGELVPVLDKGHTGGLVVRGPHSAFRRELRRVMFLVIPGTDTI
jgi:hypothetical protein